MKNTPKYLQIAQAMKDMVQKDEWPINQLIPTESQLVEYFGVSRITIRGAIKELASEGYVQKRSGIGTKVIRKIKQQNFIHTSNSLESILQFTGQTRLKLISHSLVNELPNALFNDHNTEFHLSSHLHIKALRLKKNLEPICLSDFYIPLIYQSILNFLPNHKGSIALLMEKKLGVHLNEIEQSISVCTSSRLVSTYLKIPTKSPCLKITRWHRDPQLNPIISSENIYPEERFKYTILFRRSQLTGN
jgi:DNA-binding GntR family transcriptional regulator